MNCQRQISHKPTSGEFGAAHFYGTGVLRPSGGANAVAGCWPTSRSNLPHAGISGVCTRVAVQRFGDYSLKWISAAKCAQ